MAKVNLLANIEFYSQLRMRDFYDGLQKTLLDTARKLRCFGRLFTIATRSQSAVLLCLKSRMGTGLIKELPCCGLGSRGDL